MIPSTEVVGIIVLVSIVVVLGNCGLCGLLLLGIFTGGNLLVGGLMVDVVVEMVVLEVVVLVEVVTVEVLVLGDDMVVVVVVDVELGGMTSVNKLSHPNTLTSPGLLRVKQALGDPENKTRKKSVHRVARQILSARNFPTGRTVTVGVART